MKCCLEYRTAKGRRVLLRPDQKQPPRVFPNREAARQYVRNHREFLFRETRIIPVP
jgi:hypothetical protein